MDTKALIQITNGIYIPKDALVFKVSRSSGPGGQNVNKVNTRTTVLFDVAGCECLSDEQKGRILSSLASRADKNGVIRVVSQKYRTQAANRRAAVERLQRLLGDALRTRSVRKKTHIPYGAKQRRLEQKRHRSQLKQQRRRENLAGDIGD